MAVLSAALGLDIGDFLKGIKSASTEGTNFLRVFKGGISEASKNGAGIGTAIKTGLAGAKAEADLTKDALKDTLGSVSVEIDKVGFIKSLFGIEQAAEESAEKQAGSFGKIKQALSDATSADGLKNVATTALGVVAGDALKSLAGGISGIASAMISGNAEIETYVTQLTTLQGSSQKAKDTIKELADFGASTPFELPEIVRAQKVLLGFGLTGQVAVEKTRRSATELRNVAGDIAAGTGQSFEDISLLIGKFASGASGEAISRFQELGIVTKEQLKGVGIEFDKAGSLTSPINKALAATLDLAGEKFGGGMKALSNTYEGQLSTLSDNIGANLRELGAPFFDLAKDIVSALNEALGSDIFKQGLSIVKTLVSSLLTPIRAIGSAFSSIKGAITGFTDSLAEIGINAGAVLSMAAAFGILVVAALKVRQIITMFRLLQLAISTIPAVMGFVTAAFPILGTVGSFVLNGLSTAARVLGGSLLAITGTVLIVIASIALVVAAVTLFFTKTEVGQRIFAAFKATLIDFGKAVVQVFTEAYNNVGNFFNGVSGIVGNLGDIFTGKLSFGDAFKKGIKDAEDAAKKAAFEKDIADKIKALEPALARLGQIPIETDKLALLDDQIKKLGDSSTSAADKANISEAIARQVPGAVQGIKKIADENGNLVTVYDLNIKKVQEYADEQKKLLSGDNAAAIAKVKDGFAAQVFQLEQNKTALSGYAKQLGDVQKNIFDAQAKLRTNPNDAAAKKQLDEAIKQQDDLKTKYKETKLAVDEQTESLRGTVQQARAVGAVGKEEFAKLAGEVVKSKDAAKELVDALSTPIVPEIDLKKFSEQYDQFKNTLKNTATTNINASLQVDIAKDATVKEIGDLQKQLGKATNAEQKAYLAEQISAKEQYTKKLGEAQKDANKAAFDSTKQGLNQDRIERQRQQQIDAKEQLALSKETAAAKLGILSEQLAAERNKIDNVQKFERQALEDKIRIEREKLEQTKRFGNLTAGEAANVNRQLKELDIRAARERAELAAKQQKEEIDRVKQATDFRIKLQIDALQKEIELLTAQDEKTVAERGGKQIDLVQKQAKQTVSAFIESLPNFQQEVRKLQFKVDKGQLDAKGYIQAVDELRNSLKITLEAGEFDDSTIQTAFFATTDKLRKDELAANIKAANENELARAKAITDGAQREYALRLAQSRIARDAEIIAAGTSAAAIAQARLKYELDIIEATGQFRAAQAATSSRAEFEIRKAGLDKQLQEELAKVGDNEQRKLELIARIASQQAQAEAEQLAKENPIIRALFGVRETLYKDHYDTIEKAAEERRNASAGKEKEALKREEDILVAQLRTKEISLEEYNKRIRALQLKAQGLETSAGGQAADIGAFLQNLGNLNIKAVLDNFYASLKANAKDVLSPVFKSIADDAKSRLKLFEDTLVRRNQLAQELDANLLAQQSATGEALKALQDDYTAKKQEQVQVEQAAAQQQQQLLANVALAAGASFGQMIADGQNFGKSLVKTLFGVLKSLVPILVAQITGFSLASAESVASFGIAGIAKAAALTAGLYAVVGLAESAVASALGGFREGGFTGRGRDTDVAGVVHKEEFVSTAKTTRSEREILEFMHRGYTSEQFFEAKYLPKRAKEITQAVNVAVQDVMQTVKVQLQAAQVVIVDSVRSVAPLPTVQMILAPVNSQAILAATQTSELQEIKAHLASIERLQRQAQGRTNGDMNHHIHITTDDKELFKRAEERKQREVYG